MKNLARTFYLEAALVLCHCFSCTLLITAVPGKKKLRNIIYDNFDHSYFYFASKLTTLFTNISILYRLANDAKTKSGTRQYNGMIDVYVKTIKSDGIQGLYRGFVISCVGIFIYRGMYFGLYDSIKPIVLGDNASVFLSFILGWIVTVTAGLMSYPIDTIRRRMMMTSGQAVKYKNSMDCGMQVLKNEGFMSLMKGAGANVLRGVAGAGVLAGFDKFKEIYIAFRMG